MRNNPLLLAALAATLFPGLAAEAADPIKIGSSVGLTGYAATQDRNWRDGLLLAAETLNAKGGILGRPIDIIVEDNRSQPQDAVVAYRKMMSSDQVKLVDSGCVSAGNLAAASFLAKAELPMMLCSILPPRPEEQKWAFSFLPAPIFEMAARYDYLKTHTQIRKVGLLYDPTPYSLMQKDVATKAIEGTGLEIVASETYKPDDADVNVQLGRIAAAGAGAVIKIGQGGSTLTVAKNIKQLGLDKLLLLASTDDVALFKAAGEVLGDRFLFIASPVQYGNIGTVPGADGGAVEAFRKPWVAKYNDRDTGMAARAWDSLMMVAKAAEAAKSIDGEGVRVAFEKLGEYQGAGATYDFSVTQHVGITKNPYLVGTIVNGQPVPVK